MKNTAQNVQIFRETAQKAQKSSSSYTTAFLFPFLILLAVKYLYHSGYGTQIVGTLSIHSLIINSLAGVCFFYYVSHTKTITGLSSIWQFFLSTAYGLCSYGIVQENSIATLYLYAIFPIVFLSFEAMISGRKHLPFLLLGTLALGLDPECAIPIFLMLIILTFFELKLLKKCSLGNFCHKLSCILLVFLMAAFRIFPHLQSAYSLSVYEGFSTTCSPIVFLSRFLPGCTASIAYFASNGMDIYFGLFFLIAFFLFFAMRNISGKKRIYYGFFTVVLIASLWISPVRYVFNLFSEPGNFSLSYSFFFIFWCLKLSMEAIVYLKDIQIKDLHIGVIATALLILVSLLGSYHNFHIYVFPAIIAAFVIFSLFLYGNRTKKGNKKIIKLLFILLILAEFAFNGYFITNVDFIPGERSLSALYIWENNKISKVDSQKNTASETMDKENASDYTLTTKDPSVENLTAEISEAQTEIRTPSNNQQNSKLSTGKIAFAGVIVSCVGLFLFFSLYFNSDKEKVYAVLLSIKDGLDNLGKSPK